MASCVYKDLEMDITVVLESSEDCPSSPECKRPKKNCMDSTLPDDDCSYPCDSCDLEFSSGMSLWKHIENMHRGRLTDQLRNIVDSHSSDSHDIIEDMRNQTNDDINAYDIIGEIETQTEDADTKDINMCDLIGEVQTEAEDADAKEINMHDIIGEIETQTEDADTKDINMCDLIGEVETEAEDADTKDINVRDIIGEVETEAEDADAKDINSQDIIEEVETKAEGADTKDINTHETIEKNRTLAEDADTKDDNTRHIFWEIGTKAEDGDSKDSSTCEFDGKIGTEVGNMGTNDITMRYIIDETSSHELKRDCPGVNNLDNVISEDNNNGDEETSTEANNTEKLGENQSEKVTRGPKCGKEFNTEQKTHKCLRKVNPFPCDECGKTFPRPSDLKKHMSVHSKEKPYSCKHRWCGKTFSIQRSLNRHMRTHSAEKPFSCNQCEETFTQSSELKNHMTRHSRGRPFSRKKSTASMAASPEPEDWEDISDIKGKALDTNDFQAVVETFRRLHPAKHHSDPTQVLDSKLKEWRAKCMAAVGLESEKTYFGGTYKEHLAVSVMSRRCYDTALSIMTQYRLNQHLKQKSIIVNRALFKEVPGIRDEDALYQALLDFRDGRMGKEKFNTTLKIMKQGKIKDEMSWRRENENLRQDLKRQQAIVESQEKTIAALEEELRVLKAGASHGDGLSQMETVESRDQNVLEDKIHGAKGDETMTIGKMMEGKDEETGMWFKIKILEERHSRVKVHWMSYSKYYDSWIDRGLIRPLKSKFSEGDKVSARYKISNRTTYPAVVVAVDGDQVLLHYEDGLEKKIHQRYVEERSSAA